MVQQLKDAHERVIILRRKQVEARTGLCRSSIYAKINQDSSRPDEFDASFPKPIRLGTRAVGWLEHEVDAWIESRIAERGAA